MQLTLGFSPCPNDTFIFDALVNGHIDTLGLTFTYALEDVETLNVWAEEGRLDVTKISYNSFLHTVQHYSLLHSGSALGRGVGPLLVAARQLDMAAANEYTVAVPGYNTTANLLLSLAFPELRRKTEVLFSNIERGVIAGTYDAGLIIHESRFTYEEKGLVKLMDLGDWWETATHAAIPLGGIVIKRSLGSKVAAQVDDLIRKSLEWSWAHFPELSPFVTRHAQEMDEAVMRKHIELYVNEFTKDLGDEGNRAIKTLFEFAVRAGMIKNEGIGGNLFY